MDPPVDAVAKELVRNEQPFRNSPPPLGHLDVSPLLPDRVAVSRQVVLRAVALGIEALTSRLLRVVETDALLLGETPVDLGVTSPALGRPRQPCHGRIILIASSYQKKTSPPARVTDRTGGLDSWEYHPDIPHPVRASSSTPSEEAKELPTSPRWPSSTPHSPSSPTQPTSSERNYPRPSAVKGDDQG